MPIDGLISGLDTASIIDSLMTLERAPQTQLTNRKNSAQAAVDALKSIGGTLSTLQAAATTLQRSSGWSVRSATSSNPSALAASASAGATAASLTFTVDQLATAHGAATAVEVASANTVIASGGSISLTVGSSSHTVSVGVGHAHRGRHRDQLRIHRRACGGGLDRHRLPAPALELVHRRRRCLHGGLRPRWLVGGTVVTSQGADARIVMGTGPGAYGITSTSNTFGNVLPGVTLQVKSISAGPDHRRRRRRHARARRQGRGDGRRRQRGADRDRQAERLRPHHEDRRVADRRQRRPQARAVAPPSGERRRLRCHGRSARPGRRSGSTGTARSRSTGRSSSTATPRIRPASSACSPRTAPPPRATCRSSAPVIAPCRAPTTSWPRASPPRQPHSGSPGSPGRRTPTRPSRSASGRRGQPHRPRSATSAADTAAGAPGRVRLGRAVAHRHGVGRRDPDPDQRRRCLRRVRRGVGRLHVVGRRRRQRDRHDRRRGRRRDRQHPQHAGHCSPRAEVGCRVQLNGSTTGAIGSVTYVPGIAQRLASAVAAAHRSDLGARSPSATETRQNRINDLNQAIASYEVRLTKREALLKTQYASLEAALGNSQDPERMARRPARRASPTRTSSPPPLSPTGHDSMPLAEPTSARVADGKARYQHDGGTALSSERAIVLLYQRLERDLDEAVDALIGAASHADAHAPLIHGQEIVEALDASLAARRLGRRRRTRLAVRAPARAARRRQHRQGRRPRPALPHDRRTAGGGVAAGLGRDQLDGVLGMSLLPAGRRSDIRAPAGGSARSTSWTSGSTSALAEPHAEDGRATRSTPPPTGSWAAPEDLGPLPTELVGAAPPRCCHGSTQPDRELGRRRDAHAGRDDRTRQRRQHGADAGSTLRALGAATAASIDRDRDDRRPDLRIAWAKRPFLRTSFAEPQLRAATSDGGASTDRSKRSPRIGVAPSGEVACPQA